MIPTSSLTIPKHIAIIMDGNRRWADKFMLPKKAGHKKGAQVAKKIVLNCKNIGVKFLTLFIFSSENWSRSPIEIKDLMRLLRTYLKTNIEELIKEDIQIRFIGRRYKLDSDIQDLMKDAEERSKNNSFVLILAISYGARDEIRDAAMAFANHAKQIGKIEPNDFDQFLYTSEIPDPDLLIRTSGELRISNYLLWQLAYTELHFTNTLWPDFSKEDLMVAIKDYSSRDRRFGGRINESND